MRCVAEVQLRSCLLSLTLSYSPQPRCPTCNHGPFTERHILELQDGGFQKKPTAAELARRSPNLPAPATTDKDKGKGKAKAKPAFTVSTIAASSSQDSKSSQTVLTILDSSDEEDRKSATPKKKPVASTFKGKGKRPATTTDEDSDYDDNEPPPSVKKSSQLMYEAGSDTLGDMDSTDEEDERERRKQEQKAGASGEVKGEKAGGVALLRNDFKSSTKLDALVDSLNAAREKDPDLKAVVFSQVSLHSFAELQESHTDFYFLVF